MAGLGDLVRDSITGFEGIVLGKSEYLFGCVRCLVQARDLDKDGNVKKGEWLDEGQLKVVSKGVIEVPIATETLTSLKAKISRILTGGPREGDSNQLRKDPER